MAKYRTVWELLDKLKPEMLAKVSSALEEGAELIATEAKTRVPVDRGKLRDSIHVEMSEGKTVAYVKANARGKNRFAYGLVVEFSPAVNKPFLYPAADAKAAEVKEKVRKALSEVLTDV